MLQYNTIRNIQVYCLHTLAVLNIGLSILVCFVWLIHIIVHALGVVLRVMLCSNMLALHSNEP